MLQIVAMKLRLVFTAAILCCVSIARGDEQLFGFVRGAETLPAHRFSPTATSRDIFLRRNYEVFFCRDLIVDLGGIAKGFAVDCAVEALKDNGVEAGIVNAGGDLRTFGPAFAIHSFAPSCRAKAHCRSGATARARHGDFGDLLRTPKASCAVCEPIA